jgi:hypothetical protein
MISQGQAFAQRNCQHGIQSLNGQTPAASNRARRALFIATSPGSTTPRPVPECRQLAVLETGADRSTRADATSSACAELLRGAPKPMTSICSVCCAI